MHLTLHTLHFTLYTLFFKLHALHLTPNTLHFALYTPHQQAPHTLHDTLYTSYTPHSTLYTSHCALETPHFTLHTLHFALRTLHNTLSTLHLPLHTLHFTLYTLHFTLHTKHRKLHTLHFTLHAPLSLSYPTHYIPHSNLHPLRSTLYRARHTLYFFSLHFTLRTLMTILASHRLEIQNYLCFRFIIILLITKNITEIITKFAQASQRYHFGASGNPQSSPCGGSCRFPALPPREAQRPPKWPIFSQCLKNQNVKTNPRVFFSFFFLLFFLFFVVFFDVFSIPKRIFIFFDCAIAVVTGTIAVVTAKLRSGFAGVVMEAVSARITVAR